MDVLLKLFAVTMRLIQNMSKRSEESY